jgi:hypothetical protein
MNKSVNIEAEGNELILKNQAGDHVIIPKKYRVEVQDMIKEGCYGCIDHLVSTLPVMENYAEDGTLVPEWPPQEKPVWFPKDRKEPIPAASAINEVAPIEPSKYADRKFKNVVEKQKYWDTLPEKYGKFVDDRQAYLDFYTKELPKLRSEIPIFDLYDKSNEKLPSDLLELKNKFVPLTAKIDSLNELTGNLSLIEQESLDYEIIKLQQEQNKIFQEWKKNPANIKYLTNEPKTWKGIIEGNQNIKNPALLFSSMMDEGADKFSDTPNKFSEGMYYGFELFGLDSIGERVDEFIKKGYLDKDFKNRISTRKTWNELGEDRVTADFRNLDDIVAAKNAFILSGQEVVNNEAEKLGIKLSPDAIDYFTVASFNYGENGTKTMIKKFKDAGLLDNDKFLTMDKLPIYNEVHRNARRRVQAKHMLEGEGVVTPMKFSETAELKK